MAPSTSTPSNLHRASVACLSCRGAKVRCLLLRGAEQCHRCVTNDTECVFAQPKRAKTKSSRGPKSRNTARRVSNTLQHQARQVETVSEPTQLPWPSPSLSTTNDPFVAPGSTAQQTGLFSIQQQSPITEDIRARIIATLATLKGKRGAPFSFVTSGENQPFNSRLVGHEKPNGEGTQQSNPNSLKLSWLLRPLKCVARHQSNDEPHSAFPTAWVKMPSYASSMTLGHTVEDPIIGGILSRASSEALFRHFMVEMNARWEYLLDPVTDTHYDVRQRSPLLFATVLYCASKFANYRDGKIIQDTDAFLQSRLCSVARNLAIRAMAEGDRSIEMLQSFYLLVCWKDPDDDVSYLHSGYASRILQDLDLEHWSGDDRQAVRRRRSWLALYRQDKQQNLFFMRKSSTVFGDEGVPSLTNDISTWIQSPHSTPLDLISCCSADIRRIQCRLRAMVRKASATMLPCLLELMETELAKWNTGWQIHLIDRRTPFSGDGLAADPTMADPGKTHLKILLGLWEHGARLHISSAILRQALMESMSTSLRPGSKPPNSSIPDIADVLSTDLPGLAGSVEGALETLRHLLALPESHLRHAPDAVVLLAPNAALFLCQLLSLPGNGILGKRFQKTAVGLIMDISTHIRHAIRSPQDTLNLHSAYLDSLSRLLQPKAPHTFQDTHNPVQPQTSVPTLAQDVSGVSCSDDVAVEAAHVLAGGFAELGGITLDEAMPYSAGEVGQTLHMHGLANLLDIDYFWEIPPEEIDLGVDD